MGFRTSVEASFYMRTRVYDLVELPRLHEALWNLGVRGGIGGGGSGGGGSGDGGGGDGGLEGGRRRRGLQAPNPALGPYNYN